MFGVWYVICYKKSLTNISGKCRHSDYMQNDFFTRKEDTAHATNAIC